MPHDWLFLAPRMIKEHKAATRVYIQLSLSLSLSLSDFNCEEINRLVNHIFFPEISPYFSVLSRKI